MNKVDYTILEFWSWLTLVPFSNYSGMLETSYEYADVFIQPLFHCVRCLFSHIWLFVTPWAVAHQAPLSKEFSRQEY